MYVAVKGGEKAIENAHALLAKWRRGEASELSVKQIEEQLFLAVDRVMTEGGIYDRELAALAIKQASGDLVEAIFLLRAYRTTLPRFAVARPIDSDKLRITRRISATYKDLPGGQVLGPTYDYTHRLLDFSLLANGEQGLSDTEQTALNHQHQANDSEANSETTAEASGETMPHAFEFLFDEGLADPDADAGAVAADITEEPISFPCSRSSRLQQLTRGDEGYLLALGYSTQRGYGRNHPFAGEIRSGHALVSVDVSELADEFPDDFSDGFPVGEILITECEMVTGFVLNDQQAPKFTKGYSVVMGHAERKAMSVALIDRALQARDYGERVQAPAQDEEFVLEHADNVQAAGFVSHLKLPHYVDFQAELGLVRQIREQNQRQQQRQHAQNKKQGGDDE